MAEEYILRSDAEQWAKDCKTREGKMNDWEINFKGVCQVNSGRYLARIQVNGKPINLGLRDTTEEAASLYEAAARKYYGKYARTN